MRKLLFNLFCKIFSEDIDEMLMNRENEYQAYLEGFDSFAEYMEHLTKEAEAQAEWEEQHEWGVDEPDQELPTYYNSKQY